MLVTPDQEQLNLGLLAAAVCGVLLFLSWRIRRARSGKKTQMIAPETGPAVTQFAPAPDFTLLYDEALAVPDLSDPAAEIGLSEPDQADQEKSPDSTPSEAAPDTAAWTGVVILNDFRKAIDGGMELSAAARKHGLTEDEARVAALCYSPPDA